MAGIGTLFRDEIGVDPIRVNYDLILEGRTSGIEPIKGTLAAHKDPDFARKNIGNVFTLVTGGGGHKIRLSIVNELGDFTSPGLVPLSKIDQERWRWFVDQQPPYWEI